MWVRREGIKKKEGKKDNGANNKCAGSVEMEKGKPKSIKYGKNVIMLIRSGQTG